MFAYMCWVGLDGWVVCMKKNTGAPRQVPGGQVEPGLPSPRRRLPLTADPGDLTSGQLPGEVSNPRIVVVCNKPVYKQGQGLTNKKNMPAYAGQCCMTSTCFSAQRSIQYAYTSHTTSRVPRSVSSAASTRHALPDAVHAIHSM